MYVVSTFLIQVALDTTGGHIENKPYTHDANIFQDITVSQFIRGDTWKRNPISMM